jgi:hypothetical protein
MKLNFTADFEAGEQVVSMRFEHGILPTTVRTIAAQKNIKNVF